MLFNSLGFFVFYCFVFLLFYITPYTFRWVLLLVSSIIFYMYSGPSNIIIPLFIILTTYLGGIYINKQNSKNKKKIILLVTLILNIGILVFFKYVNFIIENVFTIVQILSNNFNRLQISNSNPFFLNFIVPLGISYISFQAIGYIVEIYEGRQTSEKHLGIFATYLIFFPKLLSGPIERAHNFIPQLYKRHTFDYQQVVNGLKLITWGLFKKMVIADRLAELTNTVFDNSQVYSGIPLIIGVLLFTVQLYADFSGYTDIALGVAQTLGFNLTRNFNSPFFAKSTTELWRRWHMSLSTWFNDYVFDSIVINKRRWKKWGVVYASMLTFLLLGLWHGASWNFFLFGLIQGFVLSIEFISKKLRKKIRSYIPAFLNNSLGIVFTFSFFSFALIFFRSTGFNDAWYIISNLFNLSINSNIGIGLDNKKIIISFGLVLLLLIIQYVQLKGSIIERLALKPVYIRWVCYYTLILSILCFGVSNKSQFIYFQF